MKKLLCVACVLVLGLSATATAATPAKVSINLSRSMARVSGEIRSSKPCVNNRKVKLFFAFTTSDDFSQVDSDRSSASGKWSIPGPDGSEIPAGRLYVKVPKRKGCAKAKSATIRSDGGGVPTSGW